MNNNAPPPLPTQPSPYDDNSKDNESTLSTLPPMRERPFQRLPTKALWRMRIAAFIPILVLCLLLAGLLFWALPFILSQGGDTMPLSTTQRLSIIGVIFFGFLGLRLWLTRLQYNYTGYRLDADGLAIRQGVLWRSETVALRTRVQHIDINRTPLSRALGLAKINVYTAGTRLGKISLDGLALEDAQYIRDQLINQENDTL